MNKRQAIKRKIGVFLATVLMSMTILPMGLVSAMAENLTVEVERSGGKTANIDFTLDGGTVSGDIICTATEVDGNSHGKKINTSLLIELEFTTTQALKPIRTNSDGEDECKGAHVTVKYEGITRSIDPILCQYGGKNRYNAAFSFIISGEDPHKNEEDKKEKKHHSSSDDSNDEPTGSFAPDTKTMTPEQQAGWSVVSREAVVTSAGTGAGISITNSYQGPLCRSAFQMAAPGYTIGHTYNMNLTAGAGGNAGLKVPTDLVKAGRKYVVAFVVPGGAKVATTTPLTPDAAGCINFNTTALGLPAGSNCAMAIMYADV